MNDPIEEEKILVSRQEWESLQDTDAFMLALMAAGVDNWDGYEVAQDIYDSYSQ